MIIRGSFEASRAVGRVGHGSGFSSLLDGARMADQIAVLEKGGVLEVGTHEELITRGGLYAELFDFKPRLTVERFSAKRPVLYLIGDITTLIPCIVDVMSPIKTPAKLRLGGVSEVAQELKVSRQQVAKLRGRPDFPAPVASLSVGDVWDLDAIRRWSESGLRRRPGRPMDSSPAMVLDRRFTLQREIGGGGFAIVYQAADLASGDDTEVAIKVLQDIAALDPEAVARFQRELQLLGIFRDPHVMPVLAYGTDSNLGIWYAMPLAQGSLADALRGLRGDTHQILEVMRQICAGLAYVHGQNVLHRDLKPENVLRTSEGTWALADFGLARAVSESTVGLTSTAEAMGTAFYTAPEQWRDAKRVDERADIYSAGKILQALVTGATPVDDTVPAGVFRPVILKAIAHDRRRRYESASEMLASIESVVALPPTGWETPEEKAARLQPRLAGSGVADVDALKELVVWAGNADPDDHNEMGQLATSLATLSSDAIAWWWESDAKAFTRVFEAFSERLTGSFSFDDCDSLADFAKRAVHVTQDPVVLREAIRGLTHLGDYHNRWHVRDVAVAVLQNVRVDEEAVAALEGLRAAGPSAIEWTVGETVRRTLHPVLRSGIAAILSGLSKR